MLSLACLCVCNWRSCIKLCTTKALNTLGSEGTREEEEEKKEHDGKQCTWYESKLTAVLWMTVDDRSV